METQKKIKGSAVVDGDGFFLFTPYNSSSRETSTQMIKATKNASLWRGKRNYSIRLRWSVNTVPPLHVLIAGFMEMYNAAILDKSNHE